jgi:hypothetical protein
MIMSRLLLRWEFLVFVTTPVYSPIEEATAL